MDIIIDCACGQHWGIFPDALRAAGPYALPRNPEETAIRWNLAGLAPLHLGADDGSAEMQAMSWVCSCGNPMTATRPFYETVACSWRPGLDGLCRKAAILENKPHDYYLNPSYGMACECCGQQGRHRVRRDRLDSWLPPCLRGKQ